MEERLTDDLVEEILLRLAPDDPVSLVRAAAVCPRWRRVASTPGFRRGFSQRHRTAPMLGFFANMRDRDEEREGDDYVARFVPATRFRPPRADRRGLQVLDARHGRVLLADIGLQVWDPVTDELWELPDVPHPHSPTSWNAAVVCAGGSCDHLYCRRKPFLVVFLDSGLEEMHVFVYSSESGTWSRTTYGPPCTPDGIKMDPPVLVGNALHFLAHASILKYDLAARSVSKILLPDDFIGFVVLTTTEDGGLGVARLEYSTIEDDGFGVTCTLRHWSMKTGPEGHVLWAQNRSIALETLLNVDAISIKNHHVAFAHGVGVFFVGTEDAWFSIDLKSEQAREENCGEGFTYGVVPYTSFYTPEFRQYGVPPV